MLAEVHRPAVELLRAACSADGIVASVVDTRNYRRVWARDAVIAGLAGVLVDDEVVVDGLAASLDALGGQLGRDGQVPSNVAAGGRGGPASYGSLAGRVDTGAWFIIGACHLLDARPDSDRRRRYRAVAEASLQLYRVWELNARGLVHVPLGGDWADEYCLQGYVLGPNLLRLWALRLAARFLGIDGAAREARVVAERVRANYWTGPEAADGQRYHPRAFEAARPLPYWHSNLSPAGYDHRFDALSNALALLLGLGTDSQDHAVLGYAAELEGQHRLVPAFWPPVQEGDRDYRILEGAAAHGFRNRPGAYHNGGLWPMVNGFWSAALSERGQDRRASATLEALVECNRQGPDGGFYEYHDAHTGQPGGTPRCTWSAAGEIMAAAFRAGRRLHSGDSP